MEHKNLTLGSLFSGSGGFELAGILAGIQPVWNSEIEPYPILVTEKRLPDVQHFGDVNTLNGAELPPVDIITFGSPCQDMSIAGKRNGLDGSRSGLFHEAVRIIREMRCATDDTYPRFIVWENVPGAFSSNSGEDFRTVLEEICKIKDSISVPRPPDKWTKAGEIVGEKFSVSWRVLDACGWGVPQRTLMRAAGEFPREENASTLSQILMDNVPETYYLSPKACLGILRRASERGKELPAVLKKALEQQAKISACVTKAENE